MSLWRSVTDDESSDSDENIELEESNNQESLEDDFSPLSTRELQKALRRETNSTYNRLKSIYYDSRFVELVSNRFPSLPLVANERCGRWYIPSPRYHSSAYFKSTDGHYGNWSFSTRRLNLDFLRTIVEHGGAILVDSTRRGKRMPDALSKTVPIWCSVLNRAVSDEDEWKTLEFPAESVPPQEASSIRALFPSFLRSLEAASVIGTSIRKLLDRPLRPSFVVPGSSLELNLSPEYYNVILVTASEVVPGGYNRHTGFTYVQGAADDEESWSHGLKSTQFWEHAAILLECNTEETLISTVKEVLDKQIPKARAIDVSCVAPTSLSLGIGSAPTNHPTIICGEDGQSTNDILYFTLSRKTKPVIALIQDIFPAAVTFAKKHSVLSCSPIIILAIDSSKVAIDLSIAITLILLTLLFDERGVPRDGRREEITKEQIRTRLVWIISARGYQVERVSRQMLKAVNTFLMSHQERGIDSGKG